MRDIDYESVTTRGSDGTLNYYSLSIFKPLIHRSTFFPESYRLPTTCDEFLQTQHCEDITLRIIVDEQKQSIGSKKYIKVQFDDLTTSSLLKFEMEEMGIYDVALLTECEQLVDITSGTIYNVSINAEALIPLKIVHLLSRYPNLESTILSLIEDLQLTEAEEYVEGLEKDHEYLEPDEEHLEPEYEEKGEDEPEYIEPEYEEGLEKEPEYLEHEYDGE